ncbi:NADH-quinone oxidoreductase subunit H [candidate division KSB1 bacterium]|nr:NADH-quinone oxidoreductase subunit H [candidate division KSB1 bacterium]
MESTFFGINTVTFITNLVIAGGIFGFMFTMGAVMSWSERKQSAQLQDRIGANRAGIPLPGGKSLKVWGFINNIADAIKCLVKEDFKPRAYDLFMYNLAIFFAFIPAVISVAVIPFAGEVHLAELFQSWYLKWIPGLPEYFATNLPNYVFRVQVANLNVGLLFVFAVGSISVFGAILAGWSSNNKFSMMGALRACSQMISYEVAMGLALLGIIFIYQTVDVWSLVQGQRELAFGWLPKWGIVLQPFAFFLFIASAVAENKRMPFDLPEAESEIISGYYTEYSAFKMLMFMFAEFIEICFVAIMITTLFFGGYSVPYLMADGFHWPWGAFTAVSHGNVVLLELGSFLTKVFFFCFLLQQARWSLPRFRYDQLMRLGWKYLLPLALLNLVVTVIIVALGGF